MTCNMSHLSSETVAIVCNYLHLHTLNSYFLFNFGVWTKLPNSFPLGSFFPIAVLGWFGEPAVFPQ